MSFDDQLRKALDRALTGVRHLDADLRAFAQELPIAAAEDRVHTAKTASEAAATDVRQQLEAQLAELRDAAQKSAEELKRSAEAELQEARRALEESRRAADEQLAVASTAAERKLSETIERIRTDHQQSMLDQTARLAEAVRALDDAAALGEVLDTLAESAAHEVERCAVLVVRGDRLVGWRLTGFARAPESPRAIDLDLDAAGLPGAVVRTGVAVSRPAAEPGPSTERQPALPPFAQDAGGRHAVALPITVGGTVVAVLYADTPQLDAPSASSRWPAVLDVLARHAGRALEAMTVQQAVGLSLPRPMARASHPLLPGTIEHAAGEVDDDAARRYARILVSEIRMYNEPLVDAGRRSRDLLSRLGGEIARARRLYEARVPASVSARGEYFDQELVRTLAGGDQSLLGGRQ